MSSTRRTSSRAAAKAASVHIENILTPRKTRSTKTTELSIEPLKVNINSADKITEKNTKSVEDEDHMKKSISKKSPKNKRTIAKETVEPEEMIDKDGVKKSKIKSSKSKKEADTEGASMNMTEKKAKRKPEKSEVGKDPVKESGPKKSMEAPEKDSRKAEKKLEQKVEEQKMGAEQSAESNEKKEEKRNERGKTNKKINKKAESTKVIKDISTSDNDQKEQINYDEEQHKFDRDIIQELDSSEGEDSSDDDDDPFKAGIPAIELNSNDKARLKKKIQALGGKLTPGVVYLGRIPHGFYEEEMKAYFSQFGTVTKLRLSRNKKTGHSKHYAFIEFASDEVARIVAETMNDYLLFGHLLKCKAISESQIHPQMWKGANSTFKVIPWQKISRDLHNKPMTEERRRHIVNNLLQKESKKRKRLEEMGIDYEFTGYAGAKMEEQKKVKKSKT